jgi:hypothetical protein
VGVQPAPFSFNESLLTSDGDREKNGAVLQTSLFTHFWIIPKWQASCILNALLIET